MIMNTYFYIQSWSSERHIANMCTEYILSATALKTFWTCLNIILFKNNLHEARGCHIRMHFWWSFISGDESG